MHTSQEKWHTQSAPRKKILESFEKDAKKLQGDPRRVLFSFLSDPYQPLEKEEQLTRYALEISAKYKLNTQILSKGNPELIQRDFDLFKKSNVHLGITLCFSDDKLRKEWEPNASSVAERMETLREAHNQGIYTWVSLEPVIDPQEALEVIRIAHPYVRFWKIGKLNHFKAIESQVDWAKFLSEATQLLQKVKANYYIKKDLEKFAEDSKLKHTA